MGKQWKNIFLYLIIVRKSFELPKETKQVLSAIDFIIRRQENVKCQNKKKINNKHDR